MQVAVSGQRVGCFRGDAAINLVKKLGVKKIYVNCIIELEGLHGREYLQGKADDIYCLFGIEVDE